LYEDTTKTCLNIHFSSSQHFVALLLSRKLTTFTEWLCGSMWEVWEYNLNPCRGKQTSAKWVNNWMTNWKTLCCRVDQQTHHSLDSIHSSPCLFQFLLFFFFLNPFFVVVLTALKLVFHFSRLSDSFSLCILLSILYPFLLSVFLLSLNPSSGFLHPHLLPPLLWKTLKLSYCHLLLQVPLSCNHDEVIFNCFQYHSCQTNVIIFVTDMTQFEWLFRDAEADKNVCFVFITL